MEEFTSSTSHTYGTRVGKKKTGKGTQQSTKQLQLNLLKHRNIKKYLQNSLMGKALKFAQEAGTLGCLSEIPLYQWRTNTRGANKRSCKSVS